MQRQRLPLIACRSNPFGPHSAPGSWASPLAGLVERKGYTLVAVQLRTAYDTLGVGCNALGMVLMSQVSSLLHVYLVYGLLIGMGFGFSGHAAITALLASSPTTAPSIELSRPPSPP